MRKRNKGGSRPRLISVMVTILLVLNCLGGAGIALASDAQGKPRAVQNGVITKIEAQAHDGSGPQGDTGQWDVFRLYAEFALPNGTIRAGDTTTIRLPDKLKFNQTSSFEIRDTGKNVVANATITDKIASVGFTVLPNSLVIMKGTWSIVHGDWRLENRSDVTAVYDVVWNEDGSFTLNLGDIAATDGFIIRYTAEASYDLADGEVIRNDAAIKGTNAVSRTTSADTYYFAAGGSAEGYVFTIRILKEDRNGNALAGGVFNVIRDANGQVVGTITTDAEGKAEVSGLLKGTYRIEETQAPDGYMPLEEPILVNPSDFDSEKIAVKTIVNEEDNGNKGGEEDNGGTTPTDDPDVTDRHVPDKPKPDSTSSETPAPPKTGDGLARFAFVLATIFTASCALFAATRRDL